MPENNPEKSEEATHDRLLRLAKEIGKVGLAFVVGFVITGFTVKIEAFPPGLPLTLGLAAAIGSYLLMRKS